MKPIIGITCNYDFKDDVGMTSNMGVPGQKWHFLADNYIVSVENAGGIPVMIPICNDFKTVKEAVSRMDGVLISGGNDVNPQEYGQRPKGYCGRIMPNRDLQDIALTRYLLDETEKPFLGICRGIQVLNVAAGGDLYQDLEREGNFERHMMDAYPLNHASHSLKISQNSRLSQIFAKTEIGVNSFHHQAVKTPGKGMTVTAQSDDGVPEGIEMEGARFVLGVQWHPEMMYDSAEQQKIFKAFIAACSPRR